MNDHQAIIDYLTSTTDIPEDLLKAIQRWLVEHGSEAATNGALHNVWELLGSPDVADCDEMLPLSSPVDADLTRALQRLMKDIDAIQPHTSETEETFVEPEFTSADEDIVHHIPFHKRVSMKWMCVAAMCAVILSVVSYILGAYYGSTSSTTTLLAAEGSVGRYTLSDGTRIWLNGGSSLSYSGDFGYGRERRVSIDGEAYFEVARDENHPFIVSMNDMDIKVLGTTFNARSSADLNTAEIVLLSGKVEVESPWLPDVAVLHPDQRLAIDRTTRQSVIEPANSRIYRRWTEPVTIFDNDPLGDILIHLSHRYGLEVKISDSDVADTRLSMTLHSSQSLDDVIEIIEHLVPVSLAVESRVLLCAEK